VDSGLNIVSLFVPQYSPCFIIS